MMFAATIPLVKLIPFAVFVGFADAHFGGAADIERAFLAEGAEEVIEEDLRLPLLIAFDVGRCPMDEIRKQRFAGIARS